MNIKEPKFITEVIKKLQKQEDELSTMNVERVRELLMASDTKFRDAFDQASDTYQRIDLLSNYIFERSPEIKEGIRAFIAAQKAANEMFTALPPEEFKKTQEWIEQQDVRTEGNRDLQKAKRLEKGYLDAEKLRAADFSNARALELIVSPELVDYVIGLCGARLYKAALEKFLQQ